MATVDRLGVVLEANDASLTSTVTRAGATVDQFGNKTNAAGRAMASTSEQSTRLREALLRQTAAQESYNRLVAAGETDVIKLSRAQAQLSSASRNVETAQRRVTAENEQARRSFSALDVVVGRAVAAVAGYAAGRAVIDLVHNSIGAASDLAETQDKVGRVFGSSAQQVLTFGNTAATALGQSRQQADEAASTFGNLLVALKIGQPQAATMSIRLVQLASDLASLNNTNPADALEALRSGIVGEVEPLRRYGVNLNDATLRQEAMRLGLGEIGATLTPLQRAQAAYSLILQQTATAQGNFGATSGGLANQQRILSAEWADAESQLGQQLLPVFLKLVQVLNQDVIPAFSATVGFISRNGDWIAPLAKGIGGLAAAWVAYSLAAKAAAAANVFFGGTAAAAGTAAVAASTEVATAAEAEMVAAGTASAAAGAAAGGAAAMGARVLPVLGAGFLAYEGTTALLHGVFGDPSKRDPATAKLGPATMQVLQPLIAQYGSLDAAEAALQVQNQVTTDSQKALAGSMDDTGTAAQKLADKIKQARQTTSQAFAGSFDVLQQYDPAKGKQAVATAQQQLADANKALRQARATAGQGADRNLASVTTAEDRLAKLRSAKNYDPIAIRAAQQRLDNLRQTVPAAQQVANALDRVRAAEKNLNAARTDADNTGNLRTIYTHDLQQGRTFVRDIRSLLRQGLNPQEIQRMLEQGPGQAGGLAHALVGDPSLIRLSNQNERALRRLGAQAANLVQQALDNHPAHVRVVVDAPKLAATLTHGLTGVPGAQPFTLAPGGLETLLRPPTPTHTVVRVVEKPTQITNHNQTHVTVHGGDVDKALAQAKRRERYAKASL